MKSTISTCAQCGRHLSAGDGDFRYCTVCRATPLPRSTAVSNTQIEVRLPAAGGFWKGLSQFLRLFWGDIMALVAIAICAGLLGQLLWEMIARNG